MMFGQHVNIEVKGDPNQPTKIKWDTLTLGDCLTALFAISEIMTEADSMIKLGKPRLQDALAVSFARCAQYVHFVIADNKSINYFAPAQNQFGQVQTVNLFLFIFPNIME